MLYAALEALGIENVTVLRGVSELVSKIEVEGSRLILDELQIDPGRIIEVELHPLIWPEFVANTMERCYFCKKRMYQSFQRILEKRNCPNLLDGSNVDDLKKYRPGFRAIHELGIQTPLLDSGLNKEEIRILAAARHLSNFDKPANSCLATRLPEGVEIKKENLKLVEKYEDFLLSRGFIGCRARPAGRDMVIELTTEGGERLLASAMRIEIIHFFQVEGFSRVLVDLTPRH